MALGTIMLMNLAMAHYPQLVVVPVYESLIVAIKMTAGMVFFDESKTYNEFQLTMVVVSVMVICSGILIIAMK